MSTPPASIGQAIPAASAAAPDPRRREPLSRARIVAAALAVLEAEGLDALSMRRVARELDAGAMSLYRHVASREEVLDLVLEELAAAIPIVPRTGDWRADLAAIARATRDALLARRDLTLLMTARLGQGPAAVAQLDRSLGVFLGAGFPAHDAARANQALGAYVAGSCTWETIGFGGAADPDERARRAADAAAALSGLSADAFPHVAAVGTELFAGTSTERFEYGLARLLDGFEARLAGLAGSAVGAPGAPRREGP